MDLNASAGSPGHLAFTDVRERGASRSGIGVDCPPSPVQQCDPRPHTRMTRCRQSRAKLSSTTLSARLPHVAQRSRCSTVAKVIPGGRRDTGTARAGHLSRSLTLVRRRSYWRRVIKYQHGKAGHWRGGSFAPPEPGPDSRLVSDDMAVKANLPSEGLHSVAEGAALLQEGCSQRLGARRCTFEIRNYNVWRHS